MKHTKQLFLLLLLAIVSNVAAWGQTTKKYGFASNKWGTYEDAGDWINGKNGNSYQQGRGVQVTTGTTGANATSPDEFSNVSNVLVIYSTNASAGAGTIKIKIGNGTEKSFAVTKTGGTTDREATFDFNPVESGAVKLTVNCTTNSIYIKSVTITYSDSSPTYTITPTSNNTDFGTVSLSGNTITATPAAGYQVSTTNPYTVTSGTATVEQNGNTFTVTPSENCTVQINFEAIPNETNLYIKADSAPFVYTWTGPEGAEIKYSGNWPGTQATETEEVNGVTWYKYTVLAKGFNLILSKKEGETQIQTSDINNITEDKYIVWNADGLSASQYLFVDDYATVTASGVTVGEGRTANSNITSTPDGLTFSYSSDNTNVATVASDGTITGVAQGSATITVSWNALEVNGLGYPGGSTTFNVTVTEAETERTYVKVTSTDDIEDGKKYLIVYEYEGGNLAFDGSLSTLNVTGNNQEVTISDNTITTDKSIYFTIDKTAGTILSASGKYIGRVSDSNGMDEDASTTYSNTISFDNNGDINIEGSGGAFLRYNNSNDVFRYYKSSTYTAQKAIQLYKEESVTQEVNIYVKSDSAPYVYTWTGEGSSKTEHMGYWPGTQTTDTEVKNGITWHKITVSAKGFNLILSKGKDQPQTENINNITEDKYIVWNSEADGYEATQTPTPYLFVGFGGVTAENKTVKVGNTTASSVTPEGFQLSYQSDNTNIATVSNDGTITGVSEGTATIKVSWNTQEVGGQGYLGGSTTFTVTVTPASTSSDVFVKATQESDLQDGMQVIIVNDDYENVMGEQKDNNFGVATVEIDKNASPYEATPGEHATILTLEGSTDAWYFKDEHGNYLYAASNSKNYLKTQSDKTDNAKATITISGDNSNAAIEFQGDHTHNIIRYNGTEQGSGIFSCYASGQNPVQIYYRESQTIIARPTIDPANGTYTEAQTVTITNNAEGATVYYTTDGTTPTTSSTVYSGPFTLSKSGTYEVKAIAVVDGNSSSVATSTITIQIYVEAPTISPEDGTQITEENSISISSASGLTIYYTTDGTDPVKNGELTGTAKAYNSAFTLTKAGTVKAVARDAGGNFSSIVSATYTYNGTATLPYYERFDEGLGNFISVNTGTVKWEFRQHTSQSFIDQYGEIRKYAYAANYDSKLHTYYSGTTRFVSPILDLTEEGLTNVMLNFIHAGAYFGSDENLKNRCKVQIITNVGGKDLSSTAVLSTDGYWTDIEVPTDGWFDYSDGKFTRKNSGDIDLSSYVGKKVRIGFWYNAGEIDYTHHGTWNVDQISIRGELVEKVKIAKPSTSPETETEGFTTYVTKNDIDAATTLTGKGVKLYKVVEFDKRNVVLVQLGLGDEGEGAVGENTYSETMVPADSPVLVKGEFGERDLVLVNSSEVIPKLRGNLLRSAVEGVTATENDHFFVLQYPKAVGAYGFHLLGTGKTVDGRKAYLNGVDEVETLTTQTNSAKGVFLFGEEEDVLPLSIQQLDVHASSVIYNDGIYDLMGRKVNTSNGHLPKGIYVVKGKKFVVK